MVEVQENPILIGNQAEIERPLVVVGIPAYNEAKTIAQVVLGAQKHAHIVIICDDGSTDLTGEIAERLGAIVIRHSSNLGYGAALQSLFKRAKDLKADVLITLDSDGQHDPAEIPFLIEPIQDGVAEVVIGSRFKEVDGTADMPKYRKFGIKVLTKLANGSIKNSISDAQSGFRAYSKSAIAQISMCENGMSASIELLREVSKSDLRIFEIPITCKYAKTVGVETSSENPVKHAIGLIMAIVKLVVEDHPLTYLGIPGILSIFVGVLFGVWMMNLYAELGQIVTNIALASISFILIGFFMISTAITLYAIARISKRTI